MLGCQGRGGEGLHPDPPRFAEMLTEEGEEADHTLKGASSLPSPANTSVSGGGSGRRPLLRLPHCRGLTYPPPRWTPLCSPASCNPPSPWRSRCYWRRWVSCWRSVAG